MFYISFYLIALHFFRYSPIMYISTTNLHLISKSKQNTHEYECVCRTELNVTSLHQYLT